MLEESLNCELKREYTDDIKKTVIAFANTNGGDIYIGVQDDGKICGVKDTDEIMLKVTSSIHDSISPDVTCITSVTVSKIDSKKVIIIHIERGTIFYRLKLVESYGVGISKIMNAYNDFSIKPKIEIGPNSFKITLPNKNYHREKELSVVSNQDFQNNNLSDTEKEVVKYLKSNSKASRIAIQNAIGKSQTTTILILKGLLQKKIIKRQGNNRSFTYLINN